MKMRASIWYFTLAGLIGCTPLVLSTAQAQDAGDTTNDDIISDDFANEVEDILGDLESDDPTPAPAPVQENEPTPSPAPDPVGADLEDIDDIDLEFDIPESPAPPAGMGTTGMEDTGVTVTEESITIDTIAPTPEFTQGTPGAVPAVQANARRPREFDQEDLGLVLRSLARQAGVTLVVSDLITGTVSMRLEDKTPLESIEIIAESKGLIVDYDPEDQVYYVKTQAEKAAEPTEAANYTFSYARASDVLPLLQSQLKSGATPAVDPRTNTIFYQEVRSGLDAIVEFLVMLDRPTRQVMIEARLVETTANPNQSYGFNWSASFSDQTIRYGGTGVEVEDGVAIPAIPEIVNGVPLLTDFLGAAISPIDLANGEDEGRSTQNNALEGGKGITPLGGQFAILSLPQLATTFDLINSDGDAELISNPRIVTADNEEAVIEILRLQPVPTLRFNEQTASAEFSGFEDREFGNTLRVLPQVNKDDYVTLTVEPEISNRVADVVFNFAGTSVSSPIVDTRRLNSKVILKSGDTLAIGGLLQDEVNKGYTKVPLLGDLPIIGYLFQHRSNDRSKRNLLIFVTPTILDERYYTGLEDQANGFTNRQEVFADPRGWRNNAKGAIRLVPTDTRSVAAETPAPGVEYDTKIQSEFDAYAPDYKMNARPREF